VYGEGEQAERYKKGEFTGIPVLFIPGNAGSYKQGIVSLCHELVIAKINLMCGIYSSVSCFFCLSQISGFKETFSL
jgi:hypothetical protein